MLSLLFKYSILFKILYSKHRKYVLHGTLRGSKYVSSHLIGLFENIFSKYIWNAGLLSIFDIKVEYNSLAVDWFVEIILVLCIMWLSLNVREPLLLILFWAIFLHAFRIASVSCNHWKQNLWFKLYSVLNTCQLLNFSELIN